MNLPKHLFGNIVDYAGLFPPAKLPLKQVVQNFADYLDCEETWMLARLIVPVGKLSEFEAETAFVESNKHWKLSVLIPSVDAECNEFDAAIETISRFNEKYKESDKAIVDTVEVKAPSLELISETISKMPASINAFLEIPHDEDPAALINAIGNGDVNIFAKIRTGGVKQELIPSPAAVARFIVECANQNVGFKATAGLHHPLRGEFRLTYEDEPELGTMFGFVNVFVAACFAFTGQNEIETIQTILEETDATAFVFSEEAITYQGHSVSKAELAEIRSNKAISFGSCSFSEPTSELKKLGWLDESLAS